MNGHDFTLEQNTEARMMLAVARRGLAAAINDAENGIGHLSCDDPKIMEQVRAHWRRLYDTYMNADALLSDLESCARHLTDGDKWEPNPTADGMKPMEMAKGCACFIAETPDGGLIIPSEPTPGENTAKRLANTLNALTGDVLLDATGIRLLGTQFLFAYHSRLDRPVDYGVNLTGMRFPDRLGLPTIYMGLPLRCEYRCFIDCDTDELLGIHPYWDPEVMNKRFRDAPDASNPHMRHDAVTYAMREPSLMREYEATKSLVAAHVKELLTGLDLAGQWSLDIMRDGDEYWLIDMAPAERSAYYRQAVPKAKRRPMMENWIPELEGNNGL